MGAHRSPLPGSSITLHRVAGSLAQKSSSRLDIMTETTAASERRAAGRPISQFDCQIAAIARAQGASVATRNTGDYDGCGVAVIDPWEQAKGR